MSSLKITTWVILTDGRYIRILYNKGQEKTLYTLKSDHFEALAELCYEVVTGIKVGAKDGTASKTKTNMRLLSDFLSEQFTQNLFGKLVVVAPQPVLNELYNLLPAQVKSAIIGELQEDSLAKPMDEIENTIACFV